MKFKIFGILIAAALLSNCSVDESISFETSYDLKNNKNLTDNDTVTKNIKKPDLTITYDENAKCNLTNDVGYLKNVKDITAGDSHTCALLDTGHVACWGGNAWNNYDTTPTCVKDLKNVVKIDSNGGNQTCALINDGTVHCTIGFGYAPEKIENIDNAIDISAGDGDHCAILSNQTLKCWGNRFSNTNDVVIVDQLKGIQSLKISSGIMCGITDNNTISCLDFGNGYNKNIKSYVLDNSENINQISFKHGSVLCSIKDDEVLCTENLQKLNQLKDTKHVETSANLNCSINSNDTVSCWNINWDSYWEIISDITVYDVPNLDNVSQLTIGGYNNLTYFYTHACALIEDGTVQCWGDNMFGQLGNGSNEFSFEPVYVKTN